MGESAVTVTLVFRLDDAETKWGETIAVVGDVESLGLWHPEASASLRSDAVTYPQWRSGRVDLASDGVHEHAIVVYKYVRDGRALGDGFSWEDSIANREIRVPMEPGSIWEVRDSVFDAPGVAEVTRIESGRSSPECRALSLEAQLPTLQGFTAAYRIVGNSPLGKGAFASVWRCQRRRTTREPCMDLAVKRIDKGDLSRAARRTVVSSEGEIHLQRGLRHPNIIRLYDSFDDGEAISMVLELCEGGDILSLVNTYKAHSNAGLPVRVAQSAMRQLLGALEHIHEHCIVHRDVKCENVFQSEARHRVLPENATFKLGDFGLSARLTPEKPVLEDHVGSHSTVAPEVTCRQPYAEPADIWSAGATLFTMLSATLMTSFHRPWRSIGSASREFLDDVMQTDPKARPSASEILMHDWLKP